MFVYIFCECMFLILYILFCVSVCAFVCEHFMSVVANFFKGARGPAHAFLRLVAMDQISESKLHTVLATICTLSSSWYKLVNKST